MAQKRIIVQILLYRRLIGIERPVGVMAIVGDRGVIRCRAGWLIGTLIPYDGNGGLRPPLYAAFRIDQDLHGLSDVRAVLVRSESVSGRCHRAHGSAR
jgi:hypothetical protein